MQHRFRVLVIEDDPELLELLDLMLSQEGFDVVTAEGGLAGLRLVYEAHPDVILLDVMMPDMDGFETCQRIRELTDVPVLLITGRATDSEDVVRGFSVGADDYLTKPVNRQELVSRLYARLRGAGETTEEGRRYLSPDASVMLNVDRHEVVVEGRTIYLPPKEFRLLQLLLRHAGQVIGTDTILSEIWGTERIGEQDLVKQYVYRLRKRIEPDPRSPRYIHAVRGGGYYFEAPDAGSMRPAVRD